MLRSVAVRVRLVRVIGAAASAVPLLILLTQPIARQDASALFLPRFTEDQPLALRIAAGTLAVRQADGGPARLQPVEARAIAFPLTRRLMMVNEEGDITGSIPNKSDQVEVRVNRRAKRDLAMSVAVKSQSGPLQQALAEDDGSAALNRGFLRKLPPILARLDPQAPLSVAAAPAAPQKLQTRLADLSIATAKDLERAHACLAQAIYFESRSEPVRGQQAVAQVVLNRVKSGIYPSSICGVIFQNKNWRNHCQFSFACDGTKKRVKDQEAWETANKIADDAISGRYFLQEIGDATHYHAAYVAPRWRRSLHRIKRIGEHIFYTIPGVAINEDE